MQALTRQRAFFIDSGFYPPSRPQEFELSAHEEFADSDSDSGLLPIVAVRIHAIPSGPEENRLSVWFTEEGLTITLGNDTTLAYHYKHMRYSAVVDAGHWRICGGFAEDEQLCPTCGDHVFGGRKTNDWQVTVCRVVGAGEGEPPAVLTPCAGAGQHGSRAGGRRRPRALPPKDAGPTGR